MTKIIEYVKDGWDVTLTVRLASTRDRLRRNALLATLNTDPAEGESLEGYFYRTQVYANCLSSTFIQNRGEENIDQQITVDEFLDLPDELGSRWLDACVEENRHWFPFFKEKPEEEGTNTEPST